MTLEINLLLLFLFSFISANLTFLLNTRILFLIKPKSAVKNPLWHVPEFVILYAFIGILAYFLEQNLGEVHEQNWQFYVTTFCLYLVFGFPGFVYRYLWKKQPKKSETPNLKVSNAIS